MNVLFQPSDTRSYPINRLVEFFSTQELGHDDAPTARSMPAGATPLERVRGTSSALQGRRIPAPLQGAPIDSETQGVALG